jgi:hypothetical protein
VHPVDLRFDFSGFWMRRTQGETPQLRLFRFAMGVVSRSIREIRWIRGAFFEMSIHRNESTEKVREAADTEHEVHGL